MTHSWCHDIARDEAVRAAEDGRDRPLPTLGEAIAAFSPSEEGLRTERVTLEIVRGDGLHVRQWPWHDILRAWGLGEEDEAESVRVVEEPESSELRHRWDRDGERCVKCRDKDWMGGPCSTTDDEYIATLTEERDAAIREREKLKARVAELEARTSTASEGSCDVAAAGGNSQAILDGSQAASVGVEGNA